jgi:hypothetical protein
METISLKADKELHIGTMEDSLRQLFKVENGSDGGLTVHDAGSRVYLYYGSDYGSKDGTIFLDYSSIDLVKRVIKIIANDPEIVIDNDFGTALPGNVFVERIIADPGWDWRL